MHEKIKTVTSVGQVPNNPHYTTTQPLFRKSITFENKTDETIITLDRNNIPVVYKNNPNRFKGEQIFIIRTTYEFLGTEMTREALIRLDEFQRIYKVQDENHLIIFKALQDSFNQHPFSTCHWVTIERQIHLEDLKKYKVVYEEGSDVLVNFSNGWLSTPHPYSQEGRMLAHHDSYVSGKKVSGCLIEVVDNEDKIGRRYVYCAKQLIRLNPVKDSSRHSGVYFTQFENCEHDADKVDPHFMNFDQAEQSLGLFKTEEEAITGGAPEILAKRVASEAQEKLEKLKQETAELSSEAKRKEVQLEIEMQALRAANTRLKEEVAASQLLREERDRKRKEKYAEREDSRKDRASRRNDYYEDRSHFRKDSSETFKWLPTLIVGAVGIAALFFK